MNGVGLDAWKEGMLATPLDANGEFVTGHSLVAVPEGGVGRVIGVHRYDDDPSDDVQGLWEAYVDVEGDRSLYETTSLLVVGSF